MKGVSEELLASLHPLELKALPHLKDGILQSELVSKTGMQEVEVVRALQWLENKKAIGMEPLSSSEILIAENGRKALEHGLPEARFLAAVKAGAKTTPEIIKAAKLDPQEYGVSVGLLKKEGLIEVGKDNTITPGADSASFEKRVKETIELLKRLPLGKTGKKDEEIITALKGRKSYVEVKEKKDRKITLTELGKELAKADLSKLDFAERVTGEDLASGKWKEKTYRSFDVTAPVRPLYPGKEHFVQDAMEYVRQIWIEMGFTEMEGDIVQSAFWDLDALFVPQDHPAREMQDTFYLETPSRTTIPRPVFERVRDVHETGGNTGSKGWRYNFSRDESERLLLRTHTTALSAHTLWKIKEGKLPMPGKYFAIGKCFRNEAVDWKHLFEFHQVEGIVVDPNVTFADFLGYLKTFFAKMGYPDIRMRPSHFPYTEPSVEIDVWNTHRKQWVEFGGAGMFRPEVTKMLLGEEVPVLAWGPGFDRIIVEYFGITDIRDLYKNDIKQMREMKRFMRIETDSVKTERKA